MNKEQVLKAIDDAIEKVKKHEDPGGAEDPDCLHGNFALQDGKDDNVQPT